MSTGEHELIAGRYRPVRQLGRGGMGVVWRAVDEVLGREVAVKELRTYTDSSGPELSELRVRMRREARAAARVRHPGVVAVHDIAEHEGRPVIVMELVDGPSLADVLAERGVMDPREAARIGAEVLGALAAAHEVGVLHRDVKPGNILLDRTGRVVLTDFGIAAVEDPGDGSATHLTRSGELVGSLDYLAPERAQGQDPGPASDVWALGATLYAAVEGASPFHRTSTWSTLTAIVTEPLPEPRGAGPLAPVLRLLMAKDPAHRPDASTAAGLLRQAADGKEAAGAGGTPAPYVPTERTALPPQGFGPPAADARGFGPPQGLPVHGAPVPGAAGPAPGGGFGGPVHEAPEAAAPGGPDRASGQGGRGARAAERARGRRRRSRTLVAAGAAAVLLVGGGVTYAFVDREEAPASGRALTGGQAGQATAAPVDDDGMPLAPGAGPTASASGPPSAAPRPSGTGGASASPSRTAPAPGAASGPAGGPAPSPGGGGRTDGDPADDGAGGAADGAPPPAGGGAAQEPACHPIGGGKYTCTVWRTADSHWDDGSRAGILNAGTNYFYCQSDLGRRETHGEWTNVWWAKTDDDSGNTGVWFSDVYIRGGDNDAPVPGLPLC
ncbi:MULTISPECIES: serine/threonine-protein kinase [Streptomyces]|uniref:non-specific serine/threonine protein kinase n=1 Tax=Streptomyces sudanensis TaxID=436397 RepID=A0ABY4THC2_9ACTN|nr:MULTISPECIES: serine/threonine-protein kinase [Streptomyces]URN18276.1 serine/threonine protein kinase [Streptomyces sudanensis]